MKSPVALLLLALSLIGGLTWVLLDGADPSDPVAGLSPAEQAVDPTDEPLAETVSAGSPEEVAGERSEVESDEPLPPAEELAGGLRGRVVRAIGGPVIGARVELRLQRRSRRGGVFSFVSRRRGGGEERTEQEAAPSVLTGPRGEFAFDQSIARGARFSLAVTHRDHASTVVSHRLPRGDDVVEGMTLRDHALDVGEVKLMVGATVRGRVVTPEGYALPQAEVELVGGGRWRAPRGDVDRSLFQPVPVDANGMFVMRHVNAGTYRFQASASEWQEKSTDETALAEGTEIDLGDIQLEPGCLVSGLVVSAADGKPVARANVSLAIQDSGRRRRSERSTTDKDGRFTIDHLPRGKASLTINARGFLDYQQQDLELQQASNSTFRVSPGLVLRGVVVDSVNGQPVTSYSISAERLGDLPNPQRDAARTKLIADATKVFSAMRSGGGTELDGAGSRAKIGELMTKFREMRSTGGGFRTSRIRGRTRAEKVKNPQGRFELTGLQEGRYVVRVTSSDHVEQLSDPVDLRLGVAAPEARVAVGSGIAVSGRVVDAKGQPIRGVRLELAVKQMRSGADSSADRVARWASMFGGQREARPGRLSARTRKDGSFTFEHVAAGDYRLTASAKGWSDGEIPELKVSGPRDDLSLTLGALASIHGVVQGVAPAERKDITVVVAKVRPTAGATGAGSERVGGRRRSFGAVSLGAGLGSTKTAKIDEAGSYRIEGLEPGAYVVRAVAGSLRTYQQARAGQGIANLTADVRLEAGGDVEHGLTVDRVPTATVTGTVRINGRLGAAARVSLRAVSTGNTGSGIGGLAAMRSRFGGGNTATADGSGQFELKGVLPGSYTLEVRKDRRSRSVLHRRSMQVGVGSMTVQIVAMTGGLTGTVALPADAGEATLESFRPRAVLLRDVAVLPTGDALRTAFRNTAGSARVDKDGAFAFDEVAAGSYFLVVTARGRELVGQPVTITGPAARPVELRIGAPRAEGSPSVPSGRGPRGVGGAPRTGGPRRGGGNADGGRRGGRGAGGRGAGGRGAGGRGAGGRGRGR